MADIPRNSFLNFADLFEFQGETFFDTPDFPELLTRTDDTFVTVDARYLGRLDLMAHDKLGTSELWWVIALANSIDLLPAGAALGVSLRVPSRVAVKNYLARGQG